MIQFLLCIFCFHIPLNQKPFGYWLKKFIYSWQRGPHSVLSCPVEGYTYWHDVGVYCKICQFDYIKYTSVGPLNIVSKFRLVCFQWYLFLLRCSGVDVRECHEKTRLKACHSLYNAVLRGCTWLAENVQYVNQSKACASVRGGGGKGGRSAAFSGRSSLLPGYQSPCPGSYIKLAGPSQSRPRLLFSSCWWSDSASEGWSSL